MWRGGQVIGFFCSTKWTELALLRAAILKARVVDNGCATTPGCKAAAGFWQLNLRRSARWNQDQPMETGSDR